MSQTKTFYLERGPINPPELHPANEDELIKVYETNDDAMTDLANMDDNEVFATRDNDYLGTVIVDKVEDGNYNPLTSNAVFDYLQDQLELSDYEAITISTNSATPTEMEYDGLLTCNIGSSSSSLSYLYINGVQIARELNPTGGGNISSSTVAVKKGDLVYIANSFVAADAHIRYYKLRDYSGR